MRLTSRARMLAAVMAAGGLSVGLFALANGSGTNGGSLPGVSAVSAPPVPHVSAVLAGEVSFPGKLPALPWPVTGEGAVAVQGVGLMAVGPTQSSVPIASVTKVMTAYIVLHDHPLVGDAGGPVLTMTEADAMGYIEASESGDSDLDVVKGEKLDERQLLEGLLIPSADNIAIVLANWDAGSVPAFVRKMNAQARVFGMTGTHYADASGLDPQSVSTAEDQARLASLAMAVPAFASIVDRASVRLPVAGTVWGYNPLIGLDGVVGLKSGFTSEASACLSVAAVRSVGGHRALLISVVLGQPDGLYGAASADAKLLDAATPLLELHRLWGRHQPIARVTAPWLGDPAGAGADSGAYLVGWPGLSASIHVSVWSPRWRKAGPAPGADLEETISAVLSGHSDWVVPAGTTVGEVVVRVDGKVHGKDRLRLVGAIDGPPPSWQSSRSS